MTTVKDSYVDLERHRQKLEEHVDKLIIALDEWRQWKAEYETLRADVKALPSSATRTDLTRTREDYEGELVNEKELIDIFGRGDSRKRDQIISTLTNRIDYVTRNIDTLTKQLEAAENKLATARVVSNPDATDEDGLPITEIVEELDENDNVISYNLRRPGDNQPQLLEALRKAGIKDLPSGDSEPVADTASETSQDAEPAASNDVKSIPPPPQLGTKPAEEPKESKPAPKKKGVKFSEDTKPAEEERPSETAKKLDEILRKAEEQQNIISDPVRPADDSPEDAAMREDMIRYNKETMEFEMAPIVAELQLEEGSTDGDFDSDDYDYDYDDDDDDDEDQWGRSKSGVVDDEWKLQMLELKERLSKHTFNHPKPAKGGEEEDDSDGDETKEGIGRIVVRHENPAVSQENIADKPVSNGATENPTATSEGKKSVRFAQTLDIAEEPVAVSEAQQPKQPEVNPISDVMERTTSTTSRPSKPTTDAPMKKPSRFRASRTPDAAAAAAAKVPALAIAPERPVDQTRYAPSGPEGRTLAASVLERAPAAEAREPDELDANLLQQQVAVEYHKMRNRFIHRQGGFMKEDENPIQPLDEEEGGPRRVSRFKAARLAGS
ncbi:Prefoldin subunit-domain-containing protein [Biscogniauxia sp. FL1348]|nr:Prefoldin subunit-domain-containing protein [Biscogniauxia sp. FL1348]